jgi:hypothetical protein
MGNLLREFSFGASLFHANRPKARPKGGIFALIDLNAHLSSRQQTPPGTGFLTDQNSLIVTQQPRLSP